MRDLRSQAVGSGLTRREFLVRTGKNAAALGVLAACAGSTVSAQEKRRIVLVAGKPSHPTMMHEYNAGCLLLKKCLDKVPGVEAAVYQNGWPTVPGSFDGAHAIMLFMDGGGGHAAIQGDNLADLAELAQRGVGLACIHYALEVPADKAGKQWQDWIGGYYEHLYSVNPMWEPKLEALPNHPITRGVQPFQVKDEWYFNMRFRPNMQGITPILVAKPSDEVRKGPYVHPAGPYDHIVAASGRDELLMWCMERPDGGRSFGFTGGHTHLHWGDDNLRKVVLNALVWIARGEVPSNGVESTVTQQDLYANLDDKPGRPSGPPAATS